MFNEMFDEMFIFASNLIQFPASVVQYPGSEGYLANYNSNPNQPHHIKLNENGSFAYGTNCTKF